MKIKKTNNDYGDSSKIPQNPLQALFYVLWPMNNSLIKKTIILVILLLTASFAIWITLPEKTKTEFIDYMKGSKNGAPPLIVSPIKEPPKFIQKDIRQHTEGDQSPTVVSNGNVNIIIGSKDSKKKE